MIRYIILLLIAVLIVSCAKDEKPQEDESDNPADTNLTPQEKFSASVLIDFLNDSSDEDLAEYLETEIYKMGSSYKGASVLEISPAMWFIMVENDTTSKNYLLQKFVDFKTNDYYFKIKETRLALTDIITRNGNKTFTSDSLK